MANYLLDTNILGFIVSGNTKNNLSVESRHIIEDFSNVLYTSLVALAELVQITRIGKLKTKYKTLTEMANAIEKEFYLKVLPFTEKHTITMSKLDIKPNHKDWIDHAVIAHAVTDKLILLSSDDNFNYYTSQKLKFVFNKI